MRVIIVGGGPAGMMAAITAAKNGNTVTLIEKNLKLGRKLYITGKGRCNFTNIRTDYMENIVNNPKFAYSALAKFSPQDCITFFESLGVKTKVERGGRVFPQSDKSSDIIDALYNEIKKLKINLLFGSEVSELKLENGKITGVIVGEKTIYCDYVILATGGKSYPLTGSDGFGLQVAQKINIDYTEFRPGLCPIILDEDIKLPEGVSLINIKASIIDENNKIIASEFGEMVFTEEGVSGPIILTLSSKINKIKNINRLSLALDLKPALSLDILEERLLREFSNNLNKSIKSILRLLMPEKMTTIVLEKSQINTETKINSITKEERINLTNTIKNLTFNIAALETIDKAIVSSGGISVKEINPNTMASKKYPNLFFAGELIDIDALTGGYNIQLALSTGFLAGKSINN